jgi:hypothetical protein
MDAIRNLKKIKLFTTFIGKKNFPLSNIFGKFNLIKLQRKNFYAFDTYNNNNNIIEFNENEFDVFLEKFQNGEIELSEIPNKLKKFIGLIKRIPSIPEKPDFNECCGEGCNPCIFDSYEEKLEKRKILIEQLLRDIKKP